MHHKRDRSRYNRTLVNHGNINLWVTPQVLDNWTAKKEKKNDPPFIYSDELIKAMCFIRFKPKLLPIFPLSIIASGHLFHLAPRKGSNP